MSLAEARVPRKTAGNRMSKLLDAEEEDEFYKTTYGGFQEESGDDEYEGDQSDSEDEVDSDFDIDEGDEPASDQEEEEPKRKRRVVTKAYKEPIKLLKPKPKKVLVPASSTEKAEGEKCAALDLQDDGGDVRKFMRHSTTEHTRLTYLRVQERQVQARRKKGPHSDRPLTQEELLEEAKVTEELNLRSLENYERLEADKKKQVHKKRKCVGPIIRYHSITMPLITEINLKEENVDVEGLDQETQQTTEIPPAPVTAPVGKCSRNFIAFSDDETFDQFFSRPKVLKVPAREICPVTHKPALYRDPITDIPYSNIRAFKIIREAYKKYVAAHGLPNTGVSSVAASGGTSTAGTAQVDPNARGTRQKIIIKQAVPST
ncbi:vacuolar protein sorting-associated protein 72 homolog [Latimeria chalumnae]|uniref:Vacuolar protein sorting-associated protein 72 homolog n=1 Tax=Latimeria chalumnae TaxID=7897 RepID=H3AY33_LATCH|nr:PREDICTED: vacuolar protein sorting-associated protein 72 homolog [Latimeria chalumnae]|eukprot:XP_005996545.1 PREDICTED: vacuolar protein sorting-associated protein 72 homolog [Latimeria chalumnae]